jgi:hypothetical protein
MPNRQVNSLRVCLGLAAALWVAGCQPAQQKAAPPAAPAASQRSDALTQSFASGSLIIPMDTTQTINGVANTPGYQNRGTFQAYGLVYKLLQNQIPVRWIALTGKAQNANEFTVTSFATTAASSTAASHTYRSGPFVVDQANAAAALPLIASWQAAATAAGVQAVTVHQATAAFSADVRRLLTAAPSVAIYADGNEDIAFNYLNLAGIPDSQGNAWPAARQATYTTPDVLTESMIAGTNTGGTVDGVLFNSDGSTNYCNVSSMHWDIGTPNATDIETVREVRQWLTGHPTHAFMECAAVTAFENTTNGHFLTDGGLDNFNTPAAVSDLQPDNMFTQYDGTFAAVNGSVSGVRPSANSGLYSNTTNLVQSTSSATMVFLTGYLDGNASNGKVSYLTGHDYALSTNVSRNNGSPNGVRFFLNGLFDSPCSVAAGQAVVTLTKSAPATVNGNTVTFTLNYANVGAGSATGMTLTDTLPTGLTFASATGGGTHAGQVVSWPLTSLAPGASGSVTVTATAAADGTYSNTGVLTYKVGTTPVTVNSNTTSTVRDTAAPNTSFLTTPANPTNSGSSTFTFASTEPNGATFVCSLDGAPPTACTSGTSFDVTEGPHTFTVAATDAAGNTDPTPASYTWTVDSSTTVAIASPANGSTTLVDLTSVSGTAEAGDTVVVKLDGNTLCTGTATGGTWSCPVSGSLTNGSHAATATATDALGNTAAASSAFTVNTSVAPPVITQPAAGSSTSSGTVVFVGTATPGTTVTVTVGSTGCTAVVSGTGAWTCTLGTTLEDGTYSASATATDGQGRTSTATTEGFTVDTQAPDTTIVSGPPALSNSASPNFTFSSTESGMTYECSLDSGAFAACPNPDTLAVGAGPHTLDVRAVDAAGNRDATPAHYTWTVDLTAPGAPTIAVPAQNATVATGTPTLSGTAEAGSTVTVKEGATVIGTAVADATGAWTLVPTAALVDGTHHVSATATDASGNVSTPATDTFTVDTLAPDTTITTGPDANTQQTSASFQFAATESPVTYECGLDGAAFAPCANPFSVSGLSQGTHTLEVRAVDAAGNKDPTPARYSWNVDTTAPIAPTFTAPAASSVIATGTPAITGHGEPGSTVTLTEGSVTVGTAVVDASGNWTFTPTTALADGAHTLKAVSTDAAGNPSTPATDTFTVDTQAPDTTITSSPPATSSSNSATFAFSSSESGVAYECSLDGAAFVPCSDPATFTGLSNGSHTLSVRAVDAAGNIDASPATDTWTVDTTSTALQITSPADGSAVNTGSPTVTGTATGVAVVVTVDGVVVCAAATVTNGQWSCPTTGLTDGTHVIGVADPLGLGAATATFTVDTHAPDTTITSGPPAQTSSPSASFQFASSEPGSTFECSLDGAAFAPCSPALTLAGLAAGSHTLLVRATDGAGNTDSTPASQTWTVTPSSVPTPPTLTSPGNGSTTPTGTPTFTGTGTPGDTVTVTVDGTSACTAAVQPDGSWSCTPATTLTDGPHAVSVVDTSPDGTPSQPTNATFTVDTAPPDTTIVTTPPQTSSSASATFRFSSNEPGVTYQCSLDGAAFAPCPDPDTLTGLSNGSHTLSVRAVDAAGNIDASPATYTWTVDTTSNPGVLTVGSPSNGTVTSNALPPFTGTGTPGDTVTVTIDGAPGCVATVQSNGTWSCTPTASLPDGQHTATATSTNPSGGTTGQVGVGFSVDTHAPDTTILSSPPATGGQSSGTFQFGSDESGVTYQCSLDGAAFASCPTPDTLTGLAGGSHTLQVRATDAAGNTDPTPASYSWTVTATTTTTSSSSSSSSSSGSSGSSGSGSTSSGSTSASTSGSSGATSASNGSGSTSASNSTSGSTSASTGTSASTSTSGGSGSTSGSSGSTASSSTSGSGSTGASGSGSTGSSGVTAGHTTGSTGSTVNASTSGSTGSTGSTASNGSTGSGSTGSGSTSSGTTGDPTITLAGGGCSSAGAGDLWLGFPGLLLLARRRRAQA